jgi:glycosyltransferase involved in cell wall biosynthesis
VTEAHDARALLVGPLPPPVGGIATIVAKMASDPVTASRFDFLDVTKRDQGFVKLYLVRPMRQLLELNRLLARRPAALFAFSSAFGSFWEKCLWLLLARRHEVPMLVMMVDGRFIDFYARLPQWRQRLVRRALETFHTVVVQSEYWRQFYSGIAPRGRFAVLPNGVNCDEFSPLPRPESARVVILFVGWLIEAKGIFDLVDAVRHIDGAGKRFVVRVVGPYHGNEQALRERVERNGLTAAFEIVGPVTSREAVLAEYRRADIFTLPSWAEGLPVSVLEAMACELPIVASRVGGVPDLVTPDCGLLTPPREPEQLASALRRLIEDGELRRSCGVASRERVRQHFSTSAFGPGVVRLIEEARR